MASNENQQKAMKRGLIKRRGRTGDSASSASQNKLALTNC